VIKAKWEPGYNAFSHENGLKFSKKIGIFLKMGFLKKKRSLLFTQIS